MVIRVLHHYKYALHRYKCAVRCYKCALSFECAACFIALQHYKFQVLDEITFERDKTRVLLVRYGHEQAHPR